MKNPCGKRCFAPAVHRRHGIATSSSDSPDGRDSSDAAAGAAARRVNAHATARVQIPTAWGTGTKPVGMDSSTVPCPVRHHRVVTDGRGPERAHGASIRKWFASCAVGSAPRCPTLPRSHFRTRATRLLLVVHR